MHMQPTTDETAVFAVAGSKLSRLQALRTTERELKLRCNISLWHTNRWLLLCSSSTGTPRRRAHHKREVPMIRIPLSGENAEDETEAFGCLGCREETTASTSRRAHLPPDLSDPTAQASSSLQEGGHDAAAKHQDDDAHSDCNSWVEVRKQRVVIIIPPLPETKFEFPSTTLARVRKDEAHCTSRKPSAVLPQDTGRAKSSSGKVYGKKAWNALKTEREGMRETTSRDPPPISGMDILLASALGADHTGWQDMRHHRIDLLASCTREEASLDTADSSIQPLPIKAKPVMVNKGALKLHCKPAHSNKSKKLMKPQNTTGFKNNLNKNKSKGTEISYVSSVNHSIRVVTLKKHLEKAGGLKGWLCSLGLSQFKEAFGKRRWSEGDLLQLQMDDLKQMG
ncbi:hypothetical protein GOP47_0001787 [Adiantum capillus-veneris]|uniref:SAM domain-containing protein n=1 Tax=Adiantum capillus-veneris TaxID=13818 RepID=A0A9D4ZNL4_ADICA|nr:hypothetical protein GOP47_0001787 [Adiantum capillus-veneris]